MEEFMRKLERYNIDDDNLDKFDNLVQEYKSKSQEEIYLQVIRINEEIEKEMSYEEYEVLFKKLKDIGPLLNDEQRIKLDYLLRELKKD